MENSQSGNGGGRAANVLGGGYLRRRLLAHRHRAPAPRCVAGSLSVLCWLWATAAGGDLPVPDVDGGGRGMNQFSSEVVFVNTTEGLVAGARRATPSVGGGGVFEFLGIPYAEPPVGSRRFRPPEARTPWQGVPNASGSRPNACPQPFDLAFGDFVGSRRWSANTPTSEDCLYLNIWTPRISFAATTAAAVRGGNESPTAASGDPSASGSPLRPLLPVMVWIHGGTFLTGSASRDVHDGKFLAAAGDVVVVSMNYRLGMLGFLAVPPRSGSPPSSPPSNWPLPGNMGLLDQVLALRWVQRNAAFFGGDPNAITLFGSSAGASSVAYHLSQPPRSAAPLFHRAIAQSGAVLSGWAHMTAESAQQRLRIAANDTPCWDLYVQAYEPATARRRRSREATTDAEGRLVECLRELPLDSVLRAQSRVTSVVQSGLLHAPFLPVLQTSEAPGLSVGGGGGYGLVPLLVGVDADESTALVVYLPELAPSFNLSDVSSPVDRAKLVRMLTASFRSYPHWPIDADANDVESIACHYANGGGVGSDETRTNLRALVTAVSDSSIVCSVIELAASHAQRAAAAAASGEPATYYYTFAHVSSNKAWGRWTGAMHGDELDYIFGDPLRQPQRYSPDERRLSEHVIKLWTNFARTGNPTSGPLEVPFTWPRFTNITRLYYEISLDSLRTPKINTVQNDNCQFLDECLSVSPRRTYTSGTRLLPDICSCPVNVHNGATTPLVTVSFIVVIVMLGITHLTG